MAKLTAAARKALPASDFAIPSKEPGSGSYPVPDRSHAQNALARVSQFGSAAEKAKVRAKVKKRFPGMMKGGSKAVRHENARMMKQKHGLSEADAARAAMRGMK